jgi:succinate dehydrogenase/fumarate reductase flavoprotein subunit
MEKTFDVVIVGGGGSGLATGVSAAQNGASVILLEKRPELGGTTGIAIGSFTANRTALQRKEGIEDNPDDHEADAGLFGPVEIQPRNDSRMRRFFLGHSAETLDWLMDMGLRFHGPSPEPPNRVARMHNVVPNAKAYIATLQSRLTVLGGTIMCNAPAEELVKEGDRIVGVRSRIDGETVTFRAGRGVVLAAGDYSNSPEIISRYKGARFSGIEGINPHCSGDGHLMAEQAGAQLLNMDVTYGPEIRFVPPARKPFSQLLPASGFMARLMGSFLPLVPRSFINAMIKRLLVTWQHPEDRLFEDGAILINNRAERFCNEKASPEREVRISEQPGKICYILLDKRLAQKYSTWPHFISTAPEIAYAYVKDYRRIRPDITIVRENFKGVAEARGLPAEPLQKTVENYNRYVSGREDDPFGRTGDSDPLVDGHWWLLGPAKAYFTTTEGGVGINESFQVLDTDGRPIEGLYAVGANGMGAMILWGHGLHIAWAITSGRMVGRLLAAKRTV